MAYQIDRRFPIQSGEEFHNVSLRLAKSSSNYPANPDQYIKDRLRRDELLKQVAGSPTLRDKLTTGGLLDGISYDMQPMCLGFDRGSGWYGVFEAYGPGSGQAYELKHLLQWEPARIMRTVGELTRRTDRNEEHSLTIPEAVNVIAITIPKQLQGYREWCTDFESYWKEPHDTPEHIQQTLRTRVDRVQYRLFQQLDRVYA